MRTNTRRLGHISMALTPKQAVLLWMREAHGFPSPSEYVRWKSKQPVGTFPLVRMPIQVEQSARDAMRGRPRQDVGWAIHTAVRDVVFLFHLHQEINAKVMDEMPLQRLRLALVAQGLQREAERREADWAMEWARAKVSMALPYPLDPETAGAVEAAMRNRVVPWEMVGLEGVEAWLRAHLVAQGKRELPWEALLWRLGLKTAVGHQVSDEDVRARFTSQQAFDAFKMDRDHHHGLADVSDAEWNANYDHVVSAVHDLAASGEVLEGTEARLETVPIPFLRWAPLVEGEWLDAAVAEMAEEGAAMLGEGRRFGWGVDDHPLGSGVPVSRVEEGKGQKAADVPLINTGKISDGPGRSSVRAPGAVREIDGRSYVRFQGEELGVDRGLVAASWNAWVEAHGGEGVAELAGVKVRKLPRPLSKAEYEVCTDPGELKKRLERRAAVMDSLRPLRTDEGGPQGAGGKQADPSLEDSLGAVFCHMHILKNAVQSLEGRYFDGTPVLYAKTGEMLEEETRAAEGVVRWYNDVVAARFVLGTGATAIDKEELRRSAQEEAQGTMEFLVDMARSETLRAMGDSDGAGRVLNRWV